MVLKQHQNDMLCKFIAFCFLTSVIISHAFSQSKISQNDRTLDSANAQFDLFKRSHKSFNGNAAFQMWEQIGADSSIDHALTYLTPNDDVWSWALQALSYTFRQKNRIVEYHQRLELLRAKISRPEILIQINWELAVYFKGLSQNQQAKRYFNNVIALGPTNPLAIMSKGLVYELDSLNIGQMAPVFSVLSIDGRRVDISKYRGKVVVLEFWATWCAPCVEIIPRLHKLYNKLRTDDLIFIGISLDQNRDDLIDFLKKKPSPWTQICDGEDGQLVKKYNASGIPRLIVIDRQGLLAGKFSSTDNIEVELPKILQNKK
jgi:thiol-disulfide isomerase/thioredoxin